MIPRTVLLTRAAEQAGETAARLRARGHVPVVAPLVRIERLPARIDDAAQAILVTSRNGAAALAGATVNRMIPVLAVGDATAADLRAAGFAEVRSAGGDAGALSRLAARLLDPGGEAVLHVRGAEIRHSPLEGLRAAGFRTAEAILYRTIPVTGLPDSAAACDTALIYSPGSARRLLDAVDFPASLHLIAISEAALAPLRDAPFAASLQAAGCPTEEAMLALLDGLPKNPVAAAPNRR